MAKLIDKIGAFIKKEEGAKETRCSHVLTFATDAGNTTLTCVKCGQSETVRNFD